MDFSVWNTFAQYEVCANSFTVNPCIPDLNILLQVRPQKSKATVKLFLYFVFDVTTTTNSHRTCAFAMTSSTHEAWIQVTNTITSNVGMATR